MQIDERKIAVFIDFENVAMGVRESRYGNFDINLVLKRLVEKGKITVKRAYSDWHRYTEFKRAFHQAAIELIDVPQSRYSGKNSADIRMVVDALDLSYQRDHIDTFVLVSGDSDFSPLVSKLREYGRYVIGMGVKQSSSDLLINNCDEFIFYEDLVRPSTENTTLAPKLDGLPRKKAEALRLVVETFEALQREGKEVIYGSAIKQTLVRKMPSFNEAYFGYPSFSRLLEDAAENKLLQLTKEQKSGGYIVSLSGEGPAAEAPVEEPEESALSGGESPPAPARESSAPTRSRSSRSRRQGAREKTKSDPQPPVESPPSGPQTGTTPKALPETPKAAAESPPPGETTSAETSADPQPPLEKKAARPRRRTSKSRSPGRKKTAAAKVAEDAPPTEVSAALPAEVSAALPAEVPAAPPDQPAESASATAAPPVGASPPAESPRPRESSAPARIRSSRSRRQGAREKAKTDPQTPIESPQTDPQSGTAPQALPETPEAPTEIPRPAEKPPAEKSADLPPPLEKKAARPRRRTSKSRSPGRKKTAAAKVAEDAPPAEVPAATPDQPAESASATAAPPAGASSPAEAPPPAAPSPSDAAKPTSETGSGAPGSRKSPGKASSARKGTTRSKTARRRKAPVRDTEPTLFSQIQDSPD